MTTVNAGSKDPKEVVSAGSDDDGEPQSVSYDTYKKVLDQRKADQAKAREYKAALDAANADKAAADEQRLADAQKFKELYEKEKADKAKLQGDMQAMTARQIESAKRDAVKAALGGVRKDDYMKFVDLSIVQLNDDGTADPESVAAAANRFRESYPELVAGKVASRMAHEAGSAITATPPKPLHQLSEAQLRAALAATNKK